MIFRDATTRRRIAVSALLAASALSSCAKSHNQPGTAASPRVVSFSPAITEMMFTMGFEDHIVGVTRLCKLPRGADKPRVGDDLSFNSEAILAVRPDIIFAQTAKAKFRGVTDIDPHVKVVPLSIESLKDIPAAMIKIGDEIDQGKVAREKADAFEKQIDAVHLHVRLLPHMRTLFVMGTDRPTVAGPGTFVSDMIDAAGGVNVGAAISGRTIWRPAQIEAIIAARPDVLICQVSPGQEDAARAYWQQWKQIPAVAAGRVQVVSDPGWSIPGPHIAKLLPELAAMIHGPRAATAPAGPTSQPANAASSGPSPASQPVVTKDPAP